MEHTRAWRPMGLLEIVDQTFRLYRANFWSFFGIALVPSVVFGFLDARIAAEHRTGDFAILLLAYLLLGMWEEAALTKAVANRYLGQPVTIRDAYGRVLRRLFPLTITGLLAYLLVCVGAVFLIVPGVVLAFWCGFFVPIVMVEERAYVAAIRRGRFLAGQRTWVGLFVLFALGTALYWAIPWALLLPTSGLGETSGVSAALRPLAVTLAAVIIEPLYVIAITLLYFDSRIRKEGFDLQLLAQELRVGPPTAEDASPSEDPRDHSQNGAT